MRTTLLLFALLISFPILSQTGTLGDPGTNESAPVVVADDDGSTYIGGVVGTESWVIKRNALGTTVWSKKLVVNHPPGSEITDLIKIGDTIFGCGFLRNSSEYVQGSLYFKMNAITGTCYWCKYEATSLVYFSSIQYYQGKVILTGARAPIPYDGFFDGKVIAVSSATGNSIWQTPLFNVKFGASGADYLDDFHASTTIENGKMFITGRSYVDGAPMNMRVTLIGIDVDNGGSIFLNKYLMYNIATDFSRVYGFCIQRDGPNELVIGFAGDYLCSGCSNFRMGMVKCDLNGNVTWSKYYDIVGASNEVIRGLNVTPDGYVMFGQVDANNGFLALVLLKTDKQGNFLLGKRIGQAGVNMTSYTGMINVGGSGDFKNNVHHFVGSTYITNMYQRDVFYLKANNDDLEGDNSCYTYQNLVVNTTVIPPFSGNILITNSANTLTYTTTISSNNVVVTTCPPITVNFTHSGGCGADTITVSVVGITNAEFEWSDGTTDPEVITTSTDTLHVTIHDPVTCCSYEEFVVPDFLPASDTIEIDLPADTTLCLVSGDTYGINAIVTSSQSGVNFEWNSGETTSNIAIDETGTYSVHAYVGCSEGYDTIQVTVNNFPEVDLGADAQLCASQLPYTLNAGTTNITSWLWSTGQTTSSISVSDYGAYYVTVTNECGIASDTIELTQLLIPTITLIDAVDTCLAIGQSIQVDATVTDAVDLLWSNGDTDAQLSVTTSGTYVLIAQNACGTVLDSVLMSINHFPELELGPDLELCTTALPYTITPTSAEIDNWLWSTGATTPSISVSSYGSYEVTASNECGTLSDAITLSELEFPEISLIAEIDTCLVPNGAILLTATVTSSTDILWNTGETGVEIGVEESGIYTIVAENECGAASASTQVTIEHPLVDVLPKSILTCDGVFLLTDHISTDFAITSADVDLTDNIIGESGWIYCSIETTCGTYADSVFLDVRTQDLVYLPNTFTPNGDGINELFDAKTPELTFVSCAIYNRWGERVYSEERGFSGWDGTYNGKRCPDGIYQVVVVYIDCLGVNVQLNGHVNLLR